MRVTSRWAGTFYMNVTSFQSPIFQTIVGAQAKHMAHWFPIKTNQPEIKFAVQFANEHDYELFQDYVRKSQVASLVQATDPEVTLWWPERSIRNWTGFIKEFAAGGERFDPSPRASFTVELVESMVSQKATLWSLGPNYWTLVGTEIPWIDRILKPPTPPAADQSTGVPPISSPPGDNGFGGGGQGGGVGGGGSW